MLSADERGGFVQVGVEHVKRTVFQLQREQETKKSLMNCCRLKAFLEATDNLAKLASSLFDVERYMGYIWGPMKFMLLTGSRHSETFDAILGAYEAVGEKLTFLVENERIFKKYPLMQRVLGWAYCDLLDFHLKAQQHFRRDGWKQVFKADWADFDTRLQGILASLQCLKDLAGSILRYADTRPSEDINLYLMEKLNSCDLERIKSLRELENKETEQRYKKSSHVMAWLASLRPDEDRSQLDQSAYHDFFRKVWRHSPSSGEWIIQNDKMTSWMDDDIPRSPVLWLNGIPGAGKTILASRIVEECKTKSNFGTSYFYCNDADPQRMDSLSILKGLLAQMVIQEPKLIPYFYSKAKSSGQGTLIAHQLTQSLLRISCKRMHKQFIVIDGLDECPREERRVLLSFLSEIVEEIENDEPGKLRVLIVSRDEMDIREIFSKLSHTRANFVVEQFALRQKDNKDEIESFVNRRTDIIQAKFRLCDEEADCIKRLTLARTDGMFLYAKLVLENLEEQVRKEDVVAELDERQFPSGLAEAYAKILGRLKQRWESTSRPWESNSRPWDNIIQLLGWLVCAKRPLKRYEIQCAFCLDLNGKTGELHNVESKGLMVDVKELCGTLIRELPGGRLELVHSTARWYVTTPAGAPYISKPDVECKLASFCLRYLTEDIFDPDFESADIKTLIIDGWLSMEDYAVSKWFQHLSALVKTFNEEDFKVADSSAALDYLHASMLRFLDRYADDIPDEEASEKFVMDDLAKLSSHEVYDDLIRVMSHVSRHMGKGPKFRNDVSIESLKKALERNRKLLEELSTNSKGNPRDKEALVQYYGRKHFKCSFVTCIDFYEGFTDAKSRDKHIDKHNRPWVCDVPNCTLVNFGFTSNKDLDKHMKNYHPDKTNLSEIFKLAPKRVIESSKHTCNICGKTFSRNFHKASHIRSHMGEKPFKCTECGRAFTRDNDRKRHEKTHDKR
ncbi:hypothetical protein K402DRAFT_336237 [Aulographum hederae CBS 113979]|uniref:C2H2-type domain-containing protein n=1 Tax=Aulographum hederae CBS 113979 TaxID=1176131 RepID=A0A6G1GUT9_9PEZI|nr:hypothetical protein K402DRAFT_336237 [Aulographum hederae CBS 113979]